MSYDPAFSKASAASADKQEEDTDMSHCSICANHYTCVLRKKITCTYCHKNTCSKCVENYLLSRHEDAHCLHCRVNYSDEMLRSICTMTYLKNKYFKHRQEVLINRERSMLPGLQDAALLRKKIRDQMKEIHAVYDILRNMKRERNELQSRYFVLRDTVVLLPKENITERTMLRQQMDDALLGMDHLKDMIIEHKRVYYQMRWAMQHGDRVDREGPDAAVADEAVTDIAPKEEKKTFIRRCLRKDCQGFLSTAWKCGLCEWYSCNVCLTVKGETRDSHHECKKEDIDTAELIRKDSKPCPNCGVFIQKSSGCDQMFCISCNTPFSWVTGKIVTRGPIHNPHYYEWMNRTKGSIPRNPQDIPCGGYPDEWGMYHYITIPVRKLLLWESFVQFYRLCMEIQDIGGRSYRSHMDQDAIQNLHIRFLLGDMSEAQWGRQLATQEKKRKRDAEIQEVFAAFHMVAVDMVNRVYRFTNIDGTRMSYTQSIKMLTEWKKEFDEFIDIINDAFTRISRSHSHTVPVIIRDMTLGETFKRDQNVVIGYRLGTQNVGKSKSKQASATNEEDDMDDDDHANNGPENMKEETSPRAGPVYRKSWTDSSDGSDNEELQNALRESLVSSSTKSA